MSDFSIIPDHYKHKCKFCKHYMYRSAYSKNFSEYRCINLKDKCFYILSLDQYDNKIYEIYNNTKYHIKINYTDKLLIVNQNSNVNTFNFKNKRSIDKIFRKIYKLSLFV